MLCGCHKRCFSCNIFHSFLLYGFWPLLGDGLKVSDKFRNISRGRYIYMYIYVSILHYFQSTRILFSAVNQDHVQETGCVMCKFYKYLLIIQCLYIMIFNIIYYPLPSIHHTNNGLFPACKSNIISFLCNIFPSMCNKSFLGIFRPSTTNYR